MTLIVTVETHNAKMSALEMASIFTYQGRFLCVGGYMGEGVNARQTSEKRMAIP